MYGFAKNSKNYTGNGDFFMPDEEFTLHFSRTGNVITIDTGLNVHHIKYDSTGLAVTMFRKIQRTVDGAMSNIVKIMGGNHD